MSRPLPRLVAAFAAVLAGVPLSASAGSFSFTGTFTQDADKQPIAFTIASPGTVTVHSLGFAGGTNAAASTIPAGGFDTVVQIFDGAGNLVAVNNDGGCTLVASDPVSTFCLDAYFSGALAAGTYTVYLTESDNQANGPALADGFLRDGQGNFTGPAYLGGPGSFILVNGTPRTANWALDILGVDSAGTVPVELTRFRAE